MFPGINIRMDSLSMWVSQCFPVTSQLLSKPKFSGVEKIKTIGSTYMAAAGLSGTPGQENNQVRAGGALEWGQTEFRPSESREAVTSP